jgi:phosphoribosylformimino-5-aminoimidazole carboxamide ribotide isomerase
VLARQNASFEVIPAVDVLGGRAVRLERGRRDRVTVDAGDPVELARRWAAEGASRIHLVDLDGAFTGRGDRRLVARIASIGLPVQIGGGLRTLDAADAALADGADRVIIGTAALDRSLLVAAAARFGESLVVAVDARDGRVAIEGWSRTAALAPRELAEQCADAGVTRLLVTSTGRDGTLAGPDLELLGAVAGAGLPVLAAGGIGTTEDVVAVQAAGCEGVVVGSALLRGRVQLREALAAVAGRRA